MALVRIPTPDKNLQLIQDNVQRALDQSSAMANGTVLGSPTKRIALASGSNTLPHGLATPPQYWTLLDIDAAATVYRSAWDSKTITLVASAACNVLIWIR